MLRILALLCCLAVGGAQLFGVDRGYLCFCTGAAVETPADHCHGPHGEMCASQHEAASTEHPGQCDSSDEQPHAQVREDLRLVKPGGVLAPAIVPVMLALLPLDNFGADALGWVPEVLIGPPPLLALERGVVLRI